MKNFKEAVDRTVAFFRANPDKHITISMSDTDSPFDPDATCFCFGGKLARELYDEPLGSVDDNDYARGYDELDAIYPDLSMIIYRINDDKRRSLDKKLDAIVARLTELDLYHA